jgi:FkbM family methyltransferase
MSDVAPSPSPWLRAAAALVPRLPAGRYRAMNLLARIPAAPFVAPLRRAGPDVRFECDLRNGLAREVFFTGQYEPQETLLVEALLRPGDAFVDVGAHWGYFSLLAADRVGPAGRVVSVEADPRIHAILSRNRALNPALRHWDVVHRAAAAEAGEVELEGFPEDGENWGISRIGAQLASGAPRFRVAGVPLDGLLDGLRVARVALLKMDIEGAEWLALRGMQEGLRAGRYRRLLLELHPEGITGLGGTLEGLVRQLRDAGYRGLSVRHDAAAVREAAYGTNLRAEDFLEPLVDGAGADAWPHQLWLAPGEPDAVGQGA